jgi:aminoglycoside/choline kinase family phosphotransferase/dTDP-glucose pyrophosphorylase
MKALVLAAGFGTRLLPYSGHTPKPLFTFNGRPILELIIERLARAGCDTVIINTHHGHAAIENFISRKKFQARVIIRHEKEILGTGGAVRNIADLWGPAPLLIHNADILTDIDPAAVYRFHFQHGFPVTMVLHHHERFNAVAMDDRNFVTGFSREPRPGRRILAFTGIQVIDPVVLTYIPPAGAANIIDVYQSLLDAGHRIKAFEVRQHHWTDIGTPESYRAAAVAHMIPPAFKNAFGTTVNTAVCTPLQGDGSDRLWFRFQVGRRRLIMVDHGIRNAGEGEGKLEVDAFVAIGRHLHRQGAAVPQIFLHDTFSGLVFMEDLGDRHLQTHIRNLAPEAVEALYRRIIDHWLHMALAGAQGFDPAWAYQTARYDRWVILEKECRYFLEAFVRDYLGMSVGTERLTQDFNTLADAIIAGEITAFMHRDLQSRNIMIRDETPWFIDFQGGRLGPLQYDLASLLIDPYAALHQDLQDRLVQYAADAIARRIESADQTFRQGYEACAVSRNLQILGAFAFLSRMKGKPSFEAYIPAAVRTLQFRLKNRLAGKLPDLQAIVTAIVARMDN